MKIVVAPNAYKSSLTPLEAARAIESGLRRGDPAVVCDLAPLSDGGDGFLEALMYATPGRRLKAVVRGPDHSPVGAAFGLVPDGLAVVEAAQACGLAALGDALDPLGASTGGVGELLAEARHHGASEFVVGVGGSASTDGGTGMARALGYRFLDADGAELPEGGGTLHRLDRIDASGFDTGWLMHPVTVACDVDSPLFGRLGAARVFAPQKGADERQVDLLDRGLKKLADTIRRDLRADVSELAGGGAGGGLGAGLAAFLGGRLEPGAAWLMARIDLQARLAGADLLVTGEGRLDGQSLHGKAPAEAGRMARGMGVRTIALVGSVGPGWETVRDAAFDQVIEITPERVSRSDAMTRAGELLADAAAQVTKP